MKKTFCFKVGAARRATGTKLTFVCFQNLYHSGDIFYSILDQFEACVSLDSSKLSGKVETQTKLVKKYFENSNFGPIKNNL